MNSFEKSEAAVAAHRAMQTMLTGRAQSFVEQEAFMPQMTWKDVEELVELGSVLLIDLADGAANVDNTYLTMKGDEEAKNAFYLTVSEEEILKTSEWMTQLVKASRKLVTKLRAKGKALEMARTRKPRVLSGGLESLLDQDELKDEPDLGDYSDRGSIIELDIRNAAGRDYGLGDGDNKGTVMRQGLGESRHDVDVVRGYSVEPRAPDGSQQHLRFVLVDNETAIMRSSSEQRTREHHASPRIQEQRAKKPLRPVNDYVINEMRRNPPVHNENMNRRSRVEPSFVRDYDFEDDVKPNCGIPLRESNSSTSLADQLYKLKIQREMLEIENLKNRKDTMKYPNLKEIAQPTFSGEDPHEYVYFWETFQSTVGRRTDLTDSTKFAYLKSYLTAPASDLVAELPLEDQSYKFLSDLLNERFGSRRAMEQACVSKLEKMTRVKISMDPAELIKRYQAQRNVVIRLSKLCQLSLTHMQSIKKAYPWELIRDVAARESDDRRLKRPEWDALDLLDAFEACIAIEVSKQEHQDFLGIKPAATGNIHYGQPQAVQEQQRKYERPPQTKLTCYLCDKDHLMYRCPEYTDIESRMARLKYLKRCEVCGRASPGHKNCITDPELICSVCPTAVSKHHILMCGKNRSKGRSFFSGKKQGFRGSPSAEGQR